MTKRPFGIQETDIDVEVGCISPNFWRLPNADLMEVPVNVDVTCTDLEYIRALQSRQGSGQSTGDDEMMTTVSHQINLSWLVS